MRSKLNGSETDNGDVGGSSGRRRLRAGGCLGIIVLWLCVALLSLSIGRLVVRGELLRSPGELGEQRVWLVQEGENRGFGFSSARVVSGSVDSGQACVRTRVSFLLWRADERNQRTSYCECYERIGETWQASGVCTP